MSWKCGTFQYLAFKSEPDAERGFFCWPLSGVGTKEHLRSCSTSLEGQKTSEVLSRTFIFTNSSKTCQANISNRYLLLPFPTWLNALTQGTCGAFGMLPDITAAGCKPYFYFMLVIVAVFVLSAVPSSISCGVSNSVYFLFFEGGL